MTLQELYDRIGSQLKIMPRAAGHIVTVEAGCGYMGGTSKVPIKSATDGIDWDDRYYILTPDEPLERLNDR